MSPRRRGLTVLELLIIIIVVVVAATILIRMTRGSDNEDSDAIPPDSALLAPAGAGNALTSRLGFLTTFDSLATAGDTVEVRVRATTAAGTGVAQTTIRFDVAAGDGIVVPDSAVTNDVGEATTRWVLGRTAGEQLIQASVNEEGVVPVTLSIRTVEPTPGTQDDTH